MKNIVVAVDFSNATPGILEMAVSLAKSFGAGLQLLHVVEPEPSYTAYGFTPDEFPAMNAFHEEAKRRATEKLEELLTTVKADVPNATSHMTEGSPLHALLAHVKDSGADFVVIGSHGHTAFFDLLVGSTTHGVLRRATCPVIVVPQSTHKVAAKKSL